ncbi:zf-TFIIB domain-containing protein [Armatimonas sp.]|uniref:TFIIB-type zinc ribbon-containing protein n=1 Tax=Armatimonas sp. TaxID=1872638 RepID=UPI00286D6144|nr:zf-TFIIB domain-containing protein [Armatimonas sp.]
MYCPMCSTPLRAVERQGIPIDFCPGCQGVWLDQGELDELIRREASEALLQGQRLLKSQRNARAYDRVDYDAPAPAPALNFALRPNSEIRR